jgi:hypothetical protein
MYGAFYYYEYNDYVIFEMYSWFLLKWNYESVGDVYDAFELYCRCLIVISYCIALYNA